MNLGPLLRQARQARRLSQQEVADSLRLPVAYVQAIEEERWDDLPKGYYRRAFVRAYASWLGLRLPPEALKALSDEVPDERRRPTPRLLLGTGLRRFWWPLAVCLTLAVSGIWWHLHRSEAESPLPAPAVPVPVPTARDGPAPAEGAPSAPLQLRIVAEENCWLEIYTDGRRVFLGTLRAGESYRVEAHAQIRLATVGNAGALRVFLNGQPVPSLGGPGETRRDIVLDASRLLPREAPSPESGNLYNEHVSR